MSFLVRMICWTTIEPFGFGWWTKSGHLMAGCLMIDEPSWLIGRTTALLRVACLAGRRRPRFGWLVERQVAYQLLVGLLAGPRSWFVDDGRPIRNGLFGDGEALVVDSLLDEQDLVVRWLDNGRAPVALLIDRRSALWVSAGIRASSFAAGSVGERRSHGAPMVILGETSP
jgi:hypothetical protein